MFNPSQRSTFPYWFAHWCAFQMTALNLGVWKWKYLFHDWEKPWLRLFWSYSKVQKWHRNHRKHHLEWLNNHHSAPKMDWEALVIDWECSRFTKEACQRNARQEAELLSKQGPYFEMLCSTYVIPICDRWNI